ncbi:hypothetical protein BGZ99_008259 [Dissophora globulifera]|uniref:DUF676 domain-containing protein n=1 Tax=Dissophora globulifera TaxID=979702 RepID=A0A9P6RU18_9FUNG|nr:hypothetical protein BGZ99_008259 [Dissophora globulifera]
MADGSDAHQGVHLVVLQHGLWGNVDHVRFIAAQFKERLGDRILVYRAQTNEAKFTYDGVDVCGQRLVQEIYSVVKVIETGGNIEDMKGQKFKNKKHKTRGKLHSKTTVTPAPMPATAATSTTTTTATTTPAETRVDIDQQPLSAKNLSENLDAPVDESKATTTKKVTQFSYLGYSFGGLIGRFAMGLLEVEGFFDPVDQGGRGIEPMYFVAVATPHLGIRHPPLDMSSKIFNFMSARMLSRTGAQMQLVDNYTGGRPALLVLSDPSSVFMHALARFKRRAVYCNIRNDHSVPFWTASFSDADPFIDLESLDIQYHSGYSSLIESFEHQDLDALAKRKALWKSKSFSERLLLRLKAISWKRYMLLAVLVPFFLPFVFFSITYDGLISRRRIKPIMQSNEDLKRMRDETVIMKNKGIAGAESDASSSSVIPPESELPVAQPANVDSSVTLSMPLDASTTPSASANASTSTTKKAKKAKKEQELISISYPDMKNLRPLGLAPVQLEMCKNLNQLPWIKNIIHIEGLNAHGSIVIRERRFENDGGIAAVQHAVDMFKGDGEDE